jgi:hypothetical protein
MKLVIALLLAVALPGGVASAAEGRAHWAYVPPVRSMVPATIIAGFTRNPIDQFIAAKLAEHGLKPSPMADRRTLLRRLSFDLTGLPPSADEGEAFAADTSADAFERVVDRLLSSPHFGERMAVHWLDLVRYADTRGYHGDQHQDVSRYRDYVIHAFNQNKSFDEFTTEQLAGDLLPGTSPEHRVASGYNRLLMTSSEMGVQEREYRAKYAADRVRNLASVWLASTIGCAECHDHKHDPFTTREFYRLAAFFADLKELAVGELEPVRVPSTAVTDRVNVLAREMEPLKARLSTPTPSLVAAQAKWEQSVTNWVALEPSRAKAENGTKLELENDGEIHATGDIPDKDTYVITATSRLRGMTGFMLELLPDVELTLMGPGRAQSGQFAVTEIELKANGKPVAWKSAQASQSSPGWPVASAIDGQDTTGWTGKGRIGGVMCAAFETAEKVGDGAETKLVFTIRQNAGGGRTIGRFRLLAATGPGPFEPVSLRGLPRIVARVLKINPAHRIPEFQKRVADYFRTVASELEPERTRFTALQKEMDLLSRSEPATLISEAVEPRETQVLKRGNWMDHTGEVVSPGFPAILAPAAGASASNRLDLAKWLGVRENPLVARVVVNRLWSLFFGQGLVASAEDFGTQGEAPTHPALLDWLAVNFQASEGDIKQLVRLIVVSGTYRQSSLEPAALKTADPQNQWLTRQRRFRLDAEMIRDNALRIAGLLHDQPGGASLRAYQPAGYWAVMNFPTREYEDDPAPAQYRRSVYSYWCRTFPHPSLSAFDAPARMECTARRTRSNTPQQALVLMNDPIYLEAARAFAQRLVKEHAANDESRLAAAFRIALARQPAPEETAMLLDLYRQHRRQYDADPLAAGKLLGVGNHPLPGIERRPEVAAWMSVTRVLLNLHETLTRN